MELKYDCKFYYHRFHIKRIVPTHLLTAFSDSFRDLPGQSLRSNNTEGDNLKSVLGYTKPHSPKKLFYQRLTDTIDELESKKQFNCLWLSIDMKQTKQLYLFPPKSGTVRTLLAEAAKQVEFDAAKGSGELRIFEVRTCKLLCAPMADVPLECEFCASLHFMMRFDKLIIAIRCSCVAALPSSNDMSFANPKVYRIEEVPSEEQTLNDDELLVPVFHFSKDVMNVFGIPFLVKARDAEPMGDLKERIRLKLQVPEKEWEKVRGVVDFRVWNCETINIFFHCCSCSTSWRRLLAIVLSLLMTTICYWMRMNSDRLAIRVSGYSLFDR